MPRCLVAPLLINVSSRRFVVHIVGHFLAYCEGMAERIYLTQVVG
jgi:hypothetical protein